MPFDKNILAQIIVTIENDGSEVMDNISHLGSNHFEIGVRYPGSAPWGGAGYVAVFTVEDGKVVTKSVVSVWMN